MFRLTLFAVFVFALLASAQEAEKPAPKTQVRVNLMNVCAPAEADAKEIAAALARIPAKPVFGPDYEVARGRTTEKSGASDWVRLRREFSGDTVFSNVQFLLSIGADGIDETLVLHTRENKPGEPIQISFDNEVTAGSAASVLGVDTPPSRIRVERFGKPSLVLARCAQDQKAYEPLFRTAAERFATYRGTMKVRSIVSGELARMAPAGKIDAAASKKSPPAKATP